MDLSAHDTTLWEKRIDAILRLLIAQKKLMTVDELRRGIESLDGNAYESLSYYDRWISSIALILTEKGILSQDEIDARVAAVKARSEAAE